ncbi:hypothetical protein EC396_13030 [Lutibacter sp. HS1-25]|uniref:DUF6624 domain-containing protein n=1 Tax=Lutibacter sp. HS1-25 TaxID=2485000 RepID=UPI0010130124|nr:DUF6624 domain-containing protein [Lutibacter sp. HS1-25]RXP47048.1 hypothetical protein EC396_13030 [Lutibacter sp. HS1-25]
MKRIFTFILIITMFSCKNEKKSATEKQLFESDNTELIGIYISDQSDRNDHNIDWLEVGKRDSLRRIKVNEILESNKIITARDYRNAAMVFLHGNDSTHYEKSVKLMKKAIDLDSTINKWIYAAATDSYLLSKGEPQIYGTQYFKKDDEPWRIALIDTSKISDAQRIEYGVETLNQQIHKVIQMNSGNHDDGDGH